MSVKKEVLVNVDTTETRVAVLEDDVLVELYYERPASQRTVGNIYKGKVENVLPGMQAAFVDIGLDRNAFLYVADAAPARNGEDDDELVTSMRGLSIKDLLKPGQEVVLQVTKDPIGTKGARVSAQVTLPGRYVVLMPTMDYVGVSRRIDSDTERERLKRMADKLRPHGMGVIVRTVAEGKQDQEIAQDLEFLARLWRKVQARTKTSGAPALLHRDLGLVYRVVRDLLTEDVQALTIDSEAEREKILELMDDVSPGMKGRVKYHDPSTRPLFDVYGLEPEIEKALKRRIWLKSGGYLVLDQTEAFTVMDVNTGKYVGSTNLEDTVYRTNMEAAREIARQLRLRDIGGIIVADFIDMESTAHRHAVLRALEEALRKDRTKTIVLGLTQLGLVEMTRKKVRQGLDDVLQRPCPYCEGRGRVVSEETTANRVKRELRRAVADKGGGAALAEVHPAVAAVLIGAGGANLREFERQLGVPVYVKGAEELHLEEVNIRVASSRDEIERLAYPVKVGQVVEIQVEEPHATNSWDGIARLEGYILDIEGAGKLVGQKVKAEVTHVHRTYAKARIVS